MFKSIPSLPGKPARGVFFYIFKSRKTREPDPFCIIQRCDHNVSKSVKNNEYFIFLVILQWMRLQSVSENVIK